MDHLVFLAFQEVNAKLDQLLSGQQTLINMENLAVAKIDDLEAEVTHVTSVEESAKALIEGIAAQLTELQSTDPRIQAAIDTLRAKSDALAAAVAANTTPTPATGPAAPPTA